VEPLSLVPELILFAILMVLSGFFSSSETSLFSLSRARIEQMRQDGNPRVRLIERLLSRPRRLIMTVLIGNEFVNLTASVLSASVVIHLFGLENKWINLFVMVPLLLVVGEITPKTLAMHHNVAFANFQSRPIDVFARLITPIRRLVRKISSPFITLFVGKERSRGNIITEDMVRTLARDALDEGVLDFQEARFINDILAFDDKVLEDIMTPRSHVFFLPLQMPLAEMLAEMRLVRHTKAPVFDGNRDKVVGVLNLRGLLGVDIDEVSREPGRLRRLLLSPYFVPESKLASETFHAFRERRLSMALTVDEYGGVTGLVTMEDLLECIFGDIQSPSDVGGRHMVQDGDDRLTIDGSMPVADLNKELDADLTEEWAETVGGVLLHVHGELPAVGAVIQVGVFKFTVLDVEDNRIKTVSMVTVRGTADESDDALDARAESEQNETNEV